MKQDQERPKSERGLSALKYIFPYLRPYRGLIAAWLGFLAISSAATLTLPFAVRQMIDHGFSAADAAYIDRYFVALFGVAMVLALATACRYYFVTLLGEKAIADLRVRVYQHLLKLDINFYETTRTGEVLSRLTTDTELMQTVVGSSASVAVRSVVTLLGASTLLVITSPHLAGLTALVIPLVLLPIIVFGRRVKKLSRESQDRIADASAMASENLNAMHTIQSYVREQESANQFSKVIARSLATARKRIGTRSLLIALVILFVFGAITLVLWAGAKSVLGGEMGGGTLSQFVLYAVMAAGSVGSLSEVWGELQRAAGAMERIIELLNTQPKITSPAKPKLFTLPVKGVISFDRVCFSYPSRPDNFALNDFSLQIKAGETIALVGPSGAGKSTVFQLLLRFYDPQSGSISIDGVDLNQADLAQLRSNIALVPQDTVLFGTTAHENIALGKADTDQTLVRAAAVAAEADGFISALADGYQSYLGERGVRLSGGQQQRLAIARAVLKNSPILLLDEATSALDAQSESAIQQALDRLMQNRTTIVIAHRLSTVLRADKIVVIDEGRIIATGKHHELVAQGGLYAELARLQFDQAKLGGQTLEVAEV